MRLRCWRRRVARLWLAIAGLAVRRWLRLAGLAIPRLLGCRAIGWLRGRRLLRL